MVSEELFSFCRKMETKSAGEVRRVHIVYFLSRKGRIEHPHLIRVHPLNLSGVRLRDVKRWLSDLRGEEMPDSFAWSYKRRYKAGYVWQDLLDDDLITPISDNEYVLKGSEISPIFSACSRCESKDGVEKKSTLEASTETSESLDVAKANSLIGEELKLDDNSWKTPPQIDEEFETSGEVSCSDTSTPTDDSSIQRTSPSFRKSELTIESSIRDKKDIADTVERQAAQDCSATKKKDKLKSGSNRTSKSSQVLRNLLHCGTVDTNDAAVTLINRNQASNNKNLDKRGGEICKRELIGGSERIVSGNWNQSYEKIRRNSSYKTGNQKTVSSVYKPVSEPTCSQCGKGFKPEKLHAHMKACRGLKARVKIVNAQKAAQRAATDELS